MAWLSASNSLLERRDRLAARRLGEPVHALRERPHLPGELAQGFARCDALGDAAQLGDRGLQVLQGGYVGAARREGVDLARERLHGRLDAADILRRRQGGQHVMHLAQALLDGGQGGVIAAAPATTPDPIGHGMNLRLQGIERAARQRPGQGVPDIAEIVAQPGERLLERTGPAHEVELTRQGLDLLIERRHVDGRARRLPPAARTHILVVIAPPLGIERPLARPDLVDRIAPCGRRRRDMPCLALDFLQRIVDLGDPPLELARRAAPAVDQPVDLVIQTDDRFGHALRSLLAAASQLLG